MRNAAGQPPDGIHLLRFEQLCEGGFPLPRALLDELFELLVETAQLRRSLEHALLEVGIEALQLTRLAVQIDEHLDLRAQQLGHHRNGHVVDGAELVAAQLVEVGVHDRRYEDDGGPLEARVLANHRRKLEPVQIRHADVDEDQCDVVLQQTLERLARRARFQQRLADFGEHDLMAQELRLLIVDQKDVHLVGQRRELGHGHGRCAHRCSHIRSADSNCSTLTGLAR